MKFAGPLAGEIDGEYTIAENWSETTASLSNGTISLSPVKLFSSDGATDSFDMRRDPTDDHWWTMGKVGAFAKVWSEVAACLIEAGLDMQHDDAMEHIKTKGGMAVVPGATSAAQVMRWML